jgi:hypothetical protein
LKKKKEEDIFVNLKRCKKCVLPETFPGISFDLHGICNYCQDWIPITVLGKKKLKEKLSECKNKGYEYDVLVPFSGGRDSSYVLHQMVNEYDMNVIAITVDSGFITNEGYRNIDHITEKLDVPHVYLKNAKNIEISKKNCIAKFQGWLKKPSIHTIVPVLNSGDKTMNLQMFQYAHTHHIPLMVGGNNIGNSIFEQEHWKTGFMGVFPDERGYYSKKDKVKLSLLFWNEYLKNSSNLKKSILMEYGKGAAVYFFESAMKPKDVETLGFYDYIYWKEKKIIKTITKDLGWKGASDSNTTWRVDDTAYPLINYLYYNLVGFTEHDEMYSKMIREGQISRKDAMKRLNEDHQPRFPSLSRLFTELHTTKEQVDEKVHHYRMKLLPMFFPDISINLKEQ